MRRATITTTHDDAATAARVAAALRPDNTAELTTDVAGDRVVTGIERETTGGLRSTVDDYVVNCTVATRLATGADETDDGRTDDSERDDGGTDDSERDDGGTDDVDSDPPDTDTHS